MKKKWFQLVVKINEDVAALSFLSLYGNRTEDDEEKDIVTKIEFLTTILLIKENYLHQRMVKFVNKL